MKKAMNRWINISLGFSVIWTFNLKSKGGKNFGSKGGVRYKHKIMKQQIFTYMGKIITTLIFTVFTSCIFAQKLPELSKPQMYADFDTLCMVLTKISPCDYVRRTVNKYSMTDSILSLRKTIDTLTSTESFFWLVYRSLTYVQEGHTSIRHSHSYSGIDSLDALKHHSTIADTNIIKLYDKLYSSKKSCYKLHLPIKYIDGEYRVLCDFKYKNKLIPYNSVITFCNNQNIHKYVNQLLGTAEMMHWDFENKRFYTRNFPQSFHLPCTDSIQIIFSFNEKNIEQSFLLNDTVILSKPLKYTQELIPKVLYFPNGQILYIRIPKMDEGDFYLHKIDSVSKNNKIEKIVVDIRDNPGGSDDVWMNILQHIIDKPIIRSIVICANINNYRMDIFGIDKPLKSYKNSFIKENSYQIIWDGTDTIKPETNSLNFKGKIYVIGNENCFSSANSLITTCQFSDQLVSVGNSTGWFAGLGINPWVFILPNSKILYRIEPVLDFTNLGKPDDFYHNYVKLTIDLTLDDYITRYSYSGDWYDKEFLYKFDKVFKTILEQY
jgi:hypothetical protein